LTIQQATQAIRQLGISNQILDASSWSSRHFIFDNTGKVVAFWGPTFVEQQRLHQQKNEYMGKIGEQNSNTTNNSPNWKRVSRHNLHIPRQALRRILYDSLKSETVKWGHDICSINRVIDGCRQKICLKFANRHMALYDIVIAADGIFSSVKRILDTKITSPPVINGRIENKIQCCSNSTKSNENKSNFFSPLNFLGLVVVLGFCDTQMHPLFHQRAIQMSDGHVRIFMMPFTNTQTMWQLTFRCQNLKEAKMFSKNPQKLKDYALQVCGKWAEPIPTIITNTSQEAVSGYPIYDRNPMTAKKAATRLDIGNWPQVTMVGDAAHCMSPLKGQGANQALLDAVRLSDELWKAWKRFSNNSNDNCLVNYSVGESSSDSRNEYLGNRGACKIYAEINAASSDLQLKFIQQALLRFEAEMIVRTSAKVLDSRKTVNLLHCADFIKPEYQVRRKAIGGATQLRRINRLAEKNISIKSGGQYFDDEVDCSHGASTVLDFQAFFADMES